MKYADTLRDELLDAKEKFDTAVFDRGLTAEERLVRWQAFLMKIEPIAKQLAHAEKQLAYRKARSAQRMTTGTAATL